nr:MAG TPA: hypothetical protein [Caudoviricetes sp.]
MYYIVEVLTFYMSSYLTRENNERIYSPMLTKKEFTLL